MDTSLLRRVRFLSIVTVVTALVLLAGIAQAFAVDDYPAEWKSPDKGSLTDTWGYGNRGCESFVAWRLKDLGPNHAVPYLGQSKDWLNSINARWSYDQTPTVGSVAYIYSSQHVAWVEGVGTNTVTLEEYDQNGDGAYTEHTIPTYQVSWFIHFDRVQTNPSPVIPAGMRATSVAAARMGTTASVQYAIVAGGHLWHTIRKQSGQWASRGDLGKVLSITNPVSVAAASDGIGDEAQFAVVTADGKLWHSIRDKNGRWSAAGDLGRMMRLTKVVSVTATGDGKKGEAQFVVVTSDGKVWHTIRYANGAWQKASLGAPLSTPGSWSLSGIAATTDGIEGEAQYITAPGAGPVAHSMRRPTGGWDFARSLESVLGYDKVLSVGAAGDALAGEAHFVALMNTGRVWHTVRNDKGWWSARDDITAPMGVPSARGVTLTGDGVESEVQAVIIGQDGRLWHAVKGNGRAWTPAGDLSWVLGLK
jgi:surface antigen